LITRHCLVRSVLSRDEHANDRVQESSLRSIIIAEMRPPQTEYIILIMLGTQSLATLAILEGYGCVDCEPVRTHR